MPPAFLWALGAIGAALAAKLLADAGRKANRDLEEVRSSGKDDRAKIPTLAFPTKAAASLISRGAASRFSRTRPR
jgi:hypothetical protein